MRALLERAPFVVGQAEYLDRHGSLVARLLEVTAGLALEEARIVPLHIRDERIAAIRRQAALHSRPITFNIAA
jgi:hypothetical protein